MSGVIASAENPESDMIRMPLPSRGIAALARAYLHWEGQRFPETIRGLTIVARHEDDIDDAKAIAGIEALMTRGYIAPNGKGEGMRREVEITSLGARWFELNCDYRRECNVYRFHSRFGTAGIFEFDPRRSMGSRLRDPLVLGAALAGAAFATLFIWLIP